MTVIFVGFFLWCMLS